MWRSGSFAFGGIVIGALTAFFAVKALDQAQLRDSCRHEHVAALVSETAWSIEACRKLLEVGDLPDAVEPKREEILKTLTGPVRNANDWTQVIKVAIAAFAMFWVNAFLDDVYWRPRKTPPSSGSERPAAAPPDELSPNVHRTEAASTLSAGSTLYPLDAGASAHLQGALEGAAAPPSTMVGGDENPSPPVPRRARVLLTGNLWALFCWGFMASVCVYLSAVVAGAAAAQVIREKTYIHGPHIREALRELHFVEFPNSNVDPGGYDRLAWHFFFEEGDLEKGSSCDAGKAKFADISLRFRDGLMTNDIQNRFGKIIETLATCAKNEAPVRLKAAGQASRREFAGCKPQSPALNKELATKRAEKIRDLFKAALREAKAGVQEKVAIQDEIAPYPFDFSDAEFHAADGQKIPPGELQPSPYYLAQSAALVLEDTARCSKIGAAGASPAE